jgi:hypothetical protein
MMIIDNKHFEIIEDGLTHNMAINRAHELRRGQAKNLRSHGKSNYRRHLYRVVKTASGYGIAEHRRNEYQF